MLFLSTLLLRFPPKTTKSPTKVSLLPRSHPKITKSPIKTLPQIKLSLSKRKAFKIKTFSSKRNQRRLKIQSEDTKYINMSSTSKINTPSQDLLFQREWNIWRSQEDRISTQLCPQPQSIKLPHQDLLFQWEGNIWRSQEKRTSIQIVPSIPKTRLSSQRSRFSSRKTPWRWRSNQRISHLFIRNKY